ncbi:MAG TPA: hypothetical protein VML55_13400, partial [Planctomycetaceae bacterium]|nr:hypothetical protein [Planctomycetaceae bacterium]
MSDERSSLRRRLLCRIVDFSKSPRARVRLVGVLGGLYLLVWCHGFLATWGTSLPAVAGLAAGLTLGLELAWLRRSRQNRPAATVGRTSSPSASVAFADGLEVRPTETETETETDTGTDGVLRRVPAWTPFALHLGLAAWTIALPWLSDAWSAVVARIPVTTLAVPAVTWIVLIAGGVLLLSVPAFLVAGAGLWGSAARKSGQPPFSSSPVDRHSADSHSAAECLRSWLVGVAGGLVLGVFIVAPTAGLEYGGTAAALVGAAIAVVHLMRGSRDAQGVLSISAPAETHSASFETAAARWSKRSSTHLWTFAIGCIAGAFFAASQRLAHQLMPAASATLAVQWAALLLAAAGGLGWARRRHSAGRTQDEIEATVCLQAAVAFAIVPLVFPLLIDSILLLNSHVASVWMLLAGRSLLAGLLVAPAGACLGVVLARAFAPHGQPAAEHDNTASAAAEQQVRTVALPFASFALGLVAARLLITHGVASAMLAIVAAGLLALQGAARSLRNRPAAPAWRPRLVVAGACVLPVVAAVWHTGHEPARAARLLFSTNV